MKSQTCPMSATAVLDAGFLDARARLLEVAALLDRVDRAGDPDAGRADHRYRALREALRLLTTVDGDRARALLVSLSDPTAEPRASAMGAKNAVGCWDGTRP
jgi:hypothetical protein